MSVPPNPSPARGRWHRDGVVLILVENVGQYWTCDFRPGPFGFDNPEGRAALRRAR